MMRNYTFTRFHHSRLKAPVSPTPGFSTSKDGELCAVISHMETQSSAHRLISLNSFVQIMNKEENGCMIVSDHWVRPTLLTDIPRHPSPEPPPPAVPLGLKGIPQPAKTYAASQSRRRSLDSYVSRQHLIKPQ